jgi:hypothetical protein
MSELLERVPVAVVALRAALFGAALRGLSGKSGRSGTSGNVPIATSASTAEH